MMMRADDALVDIALSTGLGDKSPLVWVAVVVMARVLGWDVVGRSKLYALGYLKQLST